MHIIYATKFQCFNMMMFLLSVVTLKSLMLSLTTTTFCAFFELPDYQVSTFFFMIWSSTYCLLGIVDLSSICLFLMISMDSCMLISSSLLNRLMNSFPHSGSNLSPFCSIRVMLSYSCNHFLLRISYLNLFFMITVNVGYVDFIYSWFVVQFYLYFLPMNHPTITR